jgi:mannosylglycerate hydrolase
VSEHHLFFHTHWDREWYLPFRQYQHRLVPVLDTVLELLENGQCSNFGLSNFTLDGQTVLLEDYREFRPDNAKRLTDLIKAKRVSIGPWFVMPDEFLVSGESLLRNLELGLSQARALGQECFTGYLPDTFGHAADMPMILSKLGIDSAVLWRGVAPKQSVFLWQSPSGHSVTTVHLSEGYFQNHAHMEDSDEAAAAGMRAFASRIQAELPEGVPTLIPVGADHLGLRPFVVKRASETFPDASVVTVDTALSAVKNAAQYLPLNTISGELLDCQKQYILPGVWSARLYLKQANRRAEWQLTQQLEPLQSLLKSIDSDFSQAAQTAFLWRTLLLNHPHDSICGCSVDAVHRENEHRFAELNQTLSGLLDDIHWTLYQVLLPENVSTDTETLPSDVLAVNLSALPYTGVLPVTLTVPEHQDLSQLPAGIQTLRSIIALEDSYKRAITTIPLAHNRCQKVDTLVWAENLAPHSVSKLPIKTPRPSAPKAEALSVSETHLENEALRVVIAPDGSISITDKTTGKDFPQLHRLTRSREQGDSYNAAPVPSSVPETAELEGVTIEATGPLRATLCLHYKFPLSLWRISTRLHLDTGARMLLFETHFVNVLKNHLVQVAFQSAAPVTQVLAEGHFNVVSRHYDPDYRIEDMMPAPANTELKTNSGPIQRFIQWQEQALITEGLTEYTVRGNDVALTLLRTFQHLSSDTTGVRGSQAGPPLETPEGQCLNRVFNWRYAWTPCSHDETTSLFHTTDQFYGAHYGIHFWPTQAVAQEIADSPTMTPLTPPSTSWLTLDNPSIHVTACRVTKDGWECHLMNPSDVPQEVTLAGRLVETTPQNKNMTIKIPQRDLLILPLMR